MVRGQAREAGETSISHPFPCANRHGGAPTDARTRQRGPYVCQGGTPNTETGKEGTKVTDEEKEILQNMREIEKRHPIARRKDGIWYEKQ